MEVDVDIYGDKNAVNIATHLFKDKVHVCIDIS